MKIHLHYFRCFHSLLCALLCLNLFASVQDVTAFKSKKILYGLALAHVLGLLKEGGGGHGGSHVVAHPMPMPMYPMPSCRKKCKKDVHIHEHINMHSYEDGGYDLGGDHYGDDDDDDDLHMGSSYGKGHGGAYLDDDAGSYKIGKSSKYMTMDDDMEDAGGQVAYDDGSEELADDEVDSTRIGSSSSRKVSPSKFLSTSSGSLKKYFKRWKRKRPKASAQPVEQDNYDDVDDEQDGKYEQLQDSESGESAEAYYPSTLTTTEPEEKNTIAPIRHTSINSMTGRKVIKSTRKSALTHRAVNTPRTVELQDSEPANSSELSDSNATASQPEPALEDVRVKISKKKKTLKTYLKKIKIGQYFKPYMLGIGKGTESKTSGAKKEQTSAIKQKKNKNMQEAETSAEASDGAQMQLDGQSQSQPQPVPMNQEQMSGFYSAMAADPSRHHPMVQPVMLMQSPPMAPHPAGAITIMEQPGSYGSYQLHHHHQHQQQLPNGQAVFVDAQTGQLLPGNPNMNHEIVAEQIVIQEPINAPPSGHILKRSESKTKR